MLQILLTLCLLLRVHLALLLLGGAFLRLGLLACLALGRRALLGRCGGGSRRLGRGLLRGALLFSGRGFNIESLSVAETMDPTVSRITLVTRGEDQVLEQIEKQLNKLISVIRVIDFTDTAHVERQLVLLQVAVDERSRGEVVNIVDVFRGKIIDVSRRSYVIEVTGTEDKIDALIELLKPIGIKEIVRTGRVAMFRGTRLLTIDAKEKERAAS